MNSKRARVFVAVILGVFAILAARIMYIWVENGKTYETMAISQQKRQVTVKSLRGDIEDRNGKKLTDSVKEKKYLTKSGEIMTRNNEAEYEFEIERRTPDTANHIIGYTNGDGQGVCGVEKTYDSLLKNKGNVILSYMADAMGTPVDSFVVNSNRKSDSARVCLTIDADVQKIAEDVMDKYIKKGAAVILDCRTFDVLAMVSRPDYNMAQIEYYKNSPDGELLNRALMGYNAGSVFKIITASAALEKKQFLCSQIF